MLKKVKYVNTICIVLAVSILALALAVGFLALSALRDNSVDPNMAGIYNEEEYDGNKSKGNGNSGNGNGTDEGDGMPHPGGNENLLPYQVRSDVDVDAVYLRAESYGNYDGKEWLPAVAYEKLIDGKYPATYLGTKQIEKWKLANPTALEIIPNDSVKVIPHYTATKILGESYKEEYDIPKDDISFVPKSNDGYRMYYYNYTDTSLEPVLPVLEYQYYEQEYRKFVYANYLDVDQTTKDFMLAIAKEQNFDKNDYELADKISEYVMNSGIYSIHYNKELDNQENVALAFLQTYKKGTCRHFATVATLLFRSLGIPARYTLGYMTETVANEWVQLTNYDAHAWVEVYVDGFGWKNIEVTPPILDQNIVLKPIDVEKMYDGTPLYPEQKIEGFETFEEKGYTYEAVISGERTKPGKTESKIESLKIFDFTGADVTSEFSITYEPGKILIYAGTITLESDDFVYTYDGQSPLSQVSGCRVVFSEGADLAEGYKLEISAKNLPSVMGVHPHAFAVKITDEAEEDITEYYKIDYKLGKVTVVASILVLKAGSASKVYDPANPTPLTCNEIEIISGTLVNGDKITAYEVAGTQTEPGRAANVIKRSSIVITSVDGEDVTSNYHILIEDGVLRVYSE